MPSSEVVINAIFSFFSAPFTAGLAGGFVRAHLTGETNKIKTFVSSIIGGLSAHYVTPGLLKYVDLSTASTSEISTVAFVVGLIGIYAADAIIRLASRYARNPSLPVTPTFGGLIEAVATTPEPEDKRKDDDSNTNA